MNTIKKGFLIFAGIILISAYLIDTQKTVYKLGENEVYLKISANTTRAELALIQTELMEAENIVIDYSKSSFKLNGEIRSLDLSVNCNDGNSGSTQISGIALLFGQYGFSRTQNDKGDYAFKIGRI